jgi:hypothetical protein
MACENMLATSSTVGALSSSVEADLEKVESAENTFLTSAKLENAVLTSDEPSGSNSGRDQGSLRNI